MARCNHTLVEREQSGDCPCCQQDKIELLRGLLDVERGVGKKLIAERDKWFNETLRLREEVETWKSRWEAERADHDATIKHCERTLDEFSA